MSILTTSIIIVGLLSSLFSLGPEFDLEAGPDHLTLLGQEAQNPNWQPGGGSAVPAAGVEDPYEQRIWTPVCLSPDSPISPDSFPTACGPVDACADGERLYRQWGLNNGVWVSLGQECRGDAPEAAPAEVTPAIVLRALRRMGLPEVEARTQPEGTTLVNFDTI